MKFGGSGAAFLVLLAVFVLVGTQGFADVENVDIRMTDASPDVKAAAQSMKELSTQVGEIRSRRGSQQLSPGEQRAFQEEAQKILKEISDYTGDVGTDGELAARINEQTEVVKQLEKGVKKDIKDIQDRYKGAKERADKAASAAGEAEAKAKEAAAYAAKDDCDEHQLKKLRREFETLRRGAERQLKQAEGLKAEGDNRQSRASDLTYKPYNTLTGDQYLLEETVKTGKQRTKDAGFGDNSDAVGYWQQAEQRLEKIAKAKQELKDHCR